MTKATQGVNFPISTDGQRSTTQMAQQVLSEALRGQRPDWANAALAEPKWRSGYLRHFSRALEAGLTSPATWGEVAAAGLTATRERMVHIDQNGIETPATDLLDRAPTRKLRSVRIGGSGVAEHLALPYQGKSLTGVPLLRQLHDWVAAGVIEPSVLTAVEAVAANPEWLSLPGRTVAVLGAGSEMGPARTLLSWGADVAAIDRPNPVIWQELINHAAHSAGTLHIPVDDHHDIPDNIAADGHDAQAAVVTLAGGDLLTDVPELATWLADQNGAPVLGNYTYADGGLHAQLSVAGDLLAQRLRRQRPDTALAFLATPTDTFTVPADAVEHARARYQRRGAISRISTGAVRALTRGSLLAPQYADGDLPRIHDALVPVQGPNYAFAKRIQRWTATVARNEGTTVSLNVAPSTRTRSVVKNRILASAYAGAHHYGVEIFEPETTNVLMAMLLVHDLSSDAPTRPASWLDEQTGAVHGGLWRSAYEPRSALNVAAIVGAPRLLLRR